jgi:hypothetical protein
MMRSDWRRNAVAVLVLLVAIGCGGSHGGEQLVPPDGNEPDDGTPSIGSGPAAAIEFITPEGDVPDVGGTDGIVFEASIGPKGSANPQASRVRFRVLNPIGRPAKDGIRVAFSVEGPTDAQLSLTAAKTVDGFVEVLMLAGEIAGNAVVVASIPETTFVARSAIMTIGRAPGGASAIEFFGLRLPGLLQEDAAPGTPSTRTQLGLRGSGFAQAVDVVFAVLDANGGPAADGTVVVFTLFGPNGGESITPPLDYSSKGFVSATISTGTRPGPVQVEAQVSGTAIAARAIPITIGSGLNPPGSHLSVAAQCLNMAGSVIFGIEDDIRIGLSDQFNNPIPVGSAVTLFTEGGVIPTQGITEDGFATSGTLVSQAPIPANHRVTVLAVTTGEESFTDLNGNGRFDAGEPFVDLPPEVYLDANEDGAYQLGEFFLDQNNNGIYDGVANGLWDDQILISDWIPIVFSGRTRIAADPTTFDLPVGGSAEISLLVSDEVGAALVGGTKIALAGTNVNVSPSSISLSDSNADTSTGPVPGLTQFTITLSNPFPAGQQTITQPASVTITLTSPTSDSTKCPNGNGDATLTIQGTAAQGVDAP